MSLLLSSIKPYKQFGKFRYIATSADSKDKEVYSNDDIDKIDQFAQGHVRTVGRLMLIKAEMVVNDK